MTPNFLTAPLAQAIGWALLHLMWQGTIVAAILAAALALLQQKSANVRYAVSCAALALLPLLAVATAWRCYEPLIVPTAAPMFLSTDSLPGDVAKAVVTQAARNAVLTAGDVARQALPYVVLAWLAGVTLLSIRLFVGFSRIEALARRAVPASAAWESVLRRLTGALGIRYGVALLETAAAEVPTVIGWLRPVILLPASALSGLTADQIEMLLAHELAHIRRNDFFVNILQSVVETLLFYHPAAWWISSRIRLERENSCDDLAVAVCGNAIDYARALTRLEELRSAHGGLVVAANGGSLVSRIRRLVGAPADTTASVSRWFAAIGVLAIVATVLSVPTLPARADREVAKPPATQPVPASRPTPTPRATAAVAPHATVNVTPEAEAIDQDDDIPDVDVDLDIDPVIAAPPAPPTPYALPHPVAVAPVAPVPAIAFANGRAPVAAFAPVAIDAAMEAVSPAIAQAVEDGVEGALAGRHDRKKRAIGESGKLTVDDLIALRAAGVTAESMADLRGAGLGELTLDEIAGLSSLGVHSKYVRDLRDAGVEIGNAHQAMELRSVNVTPQWITEMKNAGYGKISQHELVQLRAMGVNAAWVKSLSDAGLTNLSARELIRLKALGVTPEYMREMSQYRNRK